MPDRSFAFRLRRNLLPMELRIDGRRVDEVSRHILRLAEGCLPEHGLPLAGRCPVTTETRDSARPHRNVAAGSAGVLRRIALQDSRDPARKTVEDAQQLMNSLALHNAHKPFVRSRWPKAGPVP